MNSNGIDEKLNLVKQIREYETEGHKFDKHSSVSDNIEELKFKLAVFQEEQRKLHIEKELKFHESLFRIKHIFSGHPMPSKEELLKFCYGSDEYLKYRFKSAPSQK